MTSNNINNNSNIRHQGTSKIEEDRRSVVSKSSKAHSIAKRGDGSSDIRLDYNDITHNNNNNNNDIPNLKQQ